MKALILLLSLSLVLAAAPARAANCIVVETPSLGQVGDGTIRVGYVIGCAGSDLPSGYVFSVTAAYAGQTAAAWRDVAVAAIVAKANADGVYVHGLQVGATRLTTGLPNTIQATTRQ